MDTWHVAGGGSGTRWPDLSEEGDMLGEIVALHDSLLETDPTGREVRPRLSKRDDG